MSFFYRLGCTAAFVEELVRVGLGAAAWYGSYGVCKVLFNDDKEPWQGADKQFAGIGFALILLSAITYATEKYGRYAQAKFDFVQGVRDMRGPGEDRLEQRLVQ